MAFGSWKAPFPFAFGGNTRAVIDMLHRTVRAARPAALSGGDGTEVEIENRVMARMLACGWRANARRVAQRDPSKLTADVRPVTFPDGTTKTTGLLARWEALLLIVPPRNASVAQRRAAVKAALVSTTSTRREAVETAMAAIFGSWLLTVAENDVGDVDYPGRSPAGNVHALWPTTGAPPPAPDTFHSADYPGEYHATYPWRSALCHIAVQIQPPASVEQADIDARVGKAARQLGRMLPAWMSATISQLSPDQVGGGFFAGVSLVGLTAI